MRFTVRMVVRRGTKHAVTMQAASVECPHDEVNAIGEGLLAKALAQVVVDRLEDDAAGRPATTVTTDRDGSWTLTWHVDADDDLNGAVEFLDGVLGLADEILTSEDELPVQLALLRELDNLPDVGIPRAEVTGADVQSMIFRDHSRRKGLASRVGDGQSSPMDHAGAFLAILKGGS